MSTRPTSLEKIVNAARQRGRDDKNFRENETTVEHNIVVPILVELGWPKLIDAAPNSKYVLLTRHHIKGRSRKNEGGTVDIALCVQDKPKIFVEVKKVQQGGFSKKEEGQLLEYCVHDEIPVGVLTNGFDWHVYLKPKSLRPEDTASALAQEIAIDQGNVADVLRKLELLLRRNSVSSKNIERVLRKERRSRNRTRQEEENMRLMDEAWRQLFGNKRQHLQDALMAAMRKILKEQSALKWTVTKNHQIEAFIKNKCEGFKNFVGQQAVSYSDRMQSSSKTKSANSTSFQRKPASSAQQPAWFLWNGVRQESRYWKLALKEFLDKVCEKNPNAPEILANKLHRKFRQDAQGMNQPYRLGSSQVWLNLQMNTENIKNVGSRVCKVLNLPADKFKFGD